MALIKVVGLSGDVKSVPRSVYESYLKGKGYLIFNDVVKNVSRDSVDNEEDFKDEVDDNEEEDVDVESIPLGEMSGKQVKQYAEIKGIDVSNAKSTREAKDIIRNWIKENGE